jgi:ABC-type transport system substrate-binding protein
VQYAVDVDMLLQGTFLGVAERATGIIAPGLVCHRPTNKIAARDPAKARTLLAEAGLANGFKTSIGVRNSTEFLSAAQIAAASLAEVGINAEVIPFDSGQQKALAGDKSGKWKEMGLHIVRFTMLPDPSWATAWFVSSQIGEWNWERFSNPEFRPPARRRQRRARCDETRRHVDRHRMAIPFAVRRFRLHKIAPKSAGAKRLPDVLKARRETLEARWRRQQRPGWAAEVW